MKVLVYGTLKKDYWNNRLLQGKEFVGEAVISGYKLCEHGRGDIPFALPDPEGKIRGEVWDIQDDDNCRARLDALEGHPHFYRRTPARTEDGQDVEFYVLSTERYNHGLKNCPLNENNEYYWDRH